MSESPPSGAARSIEQGDPDQMTRPCKGSSRSVAAVRHSPGRALCVTVGALAALLLVIAPAVASPTDVDRRARTGVRLFRALLNADTELPEKTLDDGSLLVVFLYVEERASAQDLAALFASEEGRESAAPVRGVALTVEVVDQEGLAQLEGRRPAGIFLAEPPPERQLEQVIRFGVERGVIVYSPFEGHVERGVLAGLSIEAQVRPYLNSETLRASDISLKPFFLKVAKVFP